MTGIARMYNTDYMNDPDEGETLLAYLGLNNNNGYKASHSFIASLTQRFNTHVANVW